MTARGLMKGLLLMGLLAGFLPSWIGASVNEEEESHHSRIVEQFEALNDIYKQLRLNQGLAGDHQEESVDTPKMAAQLSNEDAVKAVAKSNLEFNGKIYPLLAKAAKAKDNIIFSSFSVSSVLAMTHAGAGGATGDQLRSGLALPSDDSVLHAGFEGLFSALKSNENFTLDAANRLFVEKNYKLLEEFLKITAAHFKAEAENVNFVSDAEAARTSINAWVEKTTHDKIKDLIPKGVLTGLTRLVLVNAVYFKGDWKAKFDPKATIPSNFSVTPEDKVIVQMMRRSGKYRGRRDNELKATVLEMPYKGDRLAFYVGLPYKPENFAETEAKWANLDIGELQFGQATKFNVQIPKFKLETSHDLNEPLAKLGMTDMFDVSKADFSKMTSDPAGLFVSKVLQKAFIEVNEKGSEAAAATGAIMMTRAMVITPEFICDRPFLFAIRDNLTGMLLFSGRVMNPTKK